VNTLIREGELRIENKKKASNSEKLLLAQRSSLSLNKSVINIISLTLGCVELFFERGANEREPRAYPGC